MQRKPNILLIPGTSSVGHPRENLTATSLELPSDTVTVLDHIATEPFPDFS
jgi:pyridoxine 4-dehydrogenase